MIDTIGRDSPIVVRGLRSLMHRRVIGSLVLSIAAVSACSNGDGIESAAVTTALATSTSGAQSVGECPGLPAGSSAAVFDPAAGVYAAQSLMLVGANEVQFDVVQWLQGEDADEAYFGETGDDSGAPNDYYIVNASDQLRASTVADDAEILVLANEGTAGSLHPVALEAIPTDQSGRTFWLTFQDSAITGICEQFRP
jgi:hypothetical protein